MGQQLTPDEKLSNLMDEVVRHIVDGYYSGAAEGLVEIAKYFAKAGLAPKQFAEIRQHLVQSAEQKTGCPIMARDFLKQAEKQLAADRKKIVITH